MQWTVEYQLEQRRLHMGTSRLEKALAKETMGLKLRQFTHLSNSGYPPEVTLQEKVVGEIYRPWKSHSPSEMSDYCIC